MNTDFHIVENKYYLTFYAYDVNLFGDITPGHFMIALGYEDMTNQRSVSDGIYGFYPVDGMLPELAKQFFGSNKNVESLVKNDLDSWLKKDLIEARMTKQVTKSQYEKVKEIIADWRANKKYHIKNNNCVHFGKAIAESIGLTVPNNVDTTLPSTFLEDLVRSNN